MKLTVRAAVAVTLLTLFVGAMVEVAYAQRRTPTDIELKAAYCIKLTQHEVEALTQVAPTATLPEVQTTVADSIREARDRLNRLQAYMLPRMSTLESLPIIGATSRGEADIENQGSLSQKCLQTCGRFSGRLSEGGAHSQCMKDCFASDPQLMGRLDACTNLDWLPF